MEVEVRVSNGNHNDLYKHPEPQQVSSSCDGEGLVPSSLNVSIGTKESKSNSCCKQKDSEKYYSRAIVYR